MHCQIDLNLKPWHGKPWHGKPWHGKSLYTARIAVYWKTSLCYKKLHIAISRLAIKFIPCDIFKVGLHREQALLGIHLPHNVLSEVINVMDVVRNTHAFLEFFFIVSVLGLLSLDEGQYIMCVFWHLSMSITFPNWSICVNNELIYSD